jgi:hypothetical protein
MNIQRSFQSVAWQGLIMCQWLGSPNLGLERTEAAWLKRSEYTALEGISLRIPNGAGSRLPIRHEKDKQYGK